MPIVRRHGALAEVRYGTHLVDRCVVAVIELDGLAVPGADAGEHRHGEQRHGGEPGDAPLPIGQHNKGREQRSDGRPEIAADLEHGLRQPVAPARGEPRHARGFRVKHRGAHADQCRRGEHHEIVRGERHQQQPAERRRHAEYERIGRGVAVGVVTDHRLQ